MYVPDVHIPIPCQVAKNKIEEYTTNKSTRKRNSEPQYKHAKFFYASPKKIKAKYRLKMETYTMRTWIKSITARNNLATSNKNSTLKLIPFADYVSIPMRPYITL